MSSEPLLKSVGDALELETVLPSPKNKYTKVFRSYWSSPEKMAREIKTWDVRQAWNNAGWTGGSSWSGTNSMEEAIQLAEEGWEEGKTKASRLQNKIRASNPIMLKRKLYSIAGSNPDVPRAISGNPLNMRVPDTAKASRKVVITLLSNMAASCSHNGDEFINRAAVLAAIIDEIEAAGYACDVITYCGSENGSFEYCSAIQVKNSNQPVDIGRLSFGLGHTAFFRRLCFAEMGYDSFNQEIEHHLGYAHPLEGNPEKHVYHIPSVSNANGAFNTEEKAETDGVQFIVRSLKEQGFPLFEAEEFRKAA